MAKSKNHTTNNHSTRHTMNDIKKPIKHRHSSTKGMDPKCLKKIGMLGSTKGRVLKSELEASFDVWKFDVMGEEVSNLWNAKEQNKFNSLVKKNRVSKSKSFLNPALASLPSKNRKSIINYYFDVHVPRRINSQTRSNCKIIDTDDEEGEEEEEGED
ncbi:hypothetical protein HAX54_027843 [Datura stramonium]|uniref:60S ribosomal protein L29 n=1 Tax=Datura stramonium TaxID=4076 RepID=A0ABS8RKN4_DATST|nr:hypothetical protein [Datura stramonium]